MSTNEVTTVEVPEHPSLAPNVRLVGEMQGTGFKDRQWLVQRGDRFVQVTELLYRVAEQADGHRTLEEIAARATEATDWIVVGEDVQLLLRTRLIPIGLISSPDETSAENAGRNRAPSPLALACAKVLGPRVIEPTAGMLQYLFAPLILAPILVLVALAHGWLYLVHGVAGSFSEVIYTPGLLLAVLTILLLSGVFHKFGHASALRYGGEVQGMGRGSTPFSIPMPRMATGSAGGPWYASVSEGFIFT